MGMPSPKHMNTEPSSAPEKYIGRDPLINDMLMILNASEKPGIFLYGTRKIGKTALLHCLKTRLLKKKKYIPCYINLEEWQGNTLASLLHSILTCLFKQFHLPPLLNENKTSLASFQSQLLDRIFPSLPEESLILLMLDECSRSSDAQLRAVRRFHAYWGKYTAQAAMPLQTVIAGGRHISDRESVYELHFSHFHFLRIPYLSDGETARLIRQSELHQTETDPLTARKTLRWPNTQIKAVHEFTAGHPFLISLLCREIRERLKNEPDVSEIRFKDVGLSFSNAMKKAEGTFCSIWNGAGIWDALILSAAGEDARQHFTAEDLADAFSQWGFSTCSRSWLQQKMTRMQHWGLLSNVKGKISFRIPMFGRWITAHRPVSAILKHFRELAAVLYKKGEENEAAGDQEKAMVQWIQAIELNPAHIRAAKKLAEAYLDRQQPRKAAALLETRYERFQSLAPLYIQSIHRLADESDSETEFALYEQILHRFPGHADTLRRCRSWYERQGDAFLRGGKAWAALDAYINAKSPGKIRKAKAAVRRKKALEKEYRRSRKNWFLLKLLGWGCAAGLFFSVLIGWGGYLAYRYFSEGLPKIHSLTDYHPPLVTTVYAADGRIIGEFYKERRIVVPLKRMSPTLIQAFISAEDARFFSHQGVDIAGIARAFFKNIEAGTVVQGGSTITQQVVKSFLLTPERSYERKIREAILAYRIDNYFSKEDILFLYLNQIYLGNGAYGVEAAAENYFGKSANSLNLAECAMLAGLCQAPSRDSPVRNLKRARQRQKYVLDRMIEGGLISHEEARKALDTPLVIPKARNYFLEEAPYFTEHIRRYIEETYGEQLLYTGGLQIYTTINPDWQKSAREALEKGLQALEKRHKYPKGISPQGALICLELKTGRVKAMVGGRDFTTHQFNRAVQALRQPGSSFKPIIYAAAIDAGYNPATILYDSPIAIPDGRKLWKPVNYDHKYYGRIPLRKALAKSRNIPAVKVLRDIGIDYAVGYARMLGITAPLNRGLSLALGASGVSLLEMAEAFSVFANQGRRMEPQFITRIVDRFSQPIRLRQPEPIQVIEPSSAYIMNSLLQSVVNKGTAVKVKKMKRPAAGKTGTTNDFRDAWYIGYTPGYIAAVWVGFDIERSLGRSEAGSKAACPIWIDFMTQILKDKPVREFPEAPEGVVFAEVEPSTGMLAAAGSGWKVKECFKEGELPKRRVIYKPAEPIVVEPEDFFKAGM